MIMEREQIWIDFCIREIDDSKSHKAIAQILQIK